MLRDFVASWFNVFMKQTEPPATPAVIVDLAIAQRNIEKLAAYGREHSLGIRPHTKTHKSARMARLQMEAGAVANWFGAPFSVVTGGAGCLIATAWVALSTPMIRRYRRSG